MKTCCHGHKMQLSKIIIFSKKTYIYICIYIYIYIYILLTTGCGIHHMRVWLRLQIIVFVTKIQICVKTGCRYNKMQLLKLIIVSKNMFSGWQPVVECIIWCGIEIEFGMWAKWAMDMNIWQEQVQCEHIKTKCARVWPVWKCSNDWPGAAAVRTPQTIIRGSGANEVPFQYKPNT